MRWFGSCGCRSNRRCGKAAVAWLALAVVSLPGQVPPGSDGPLKQTPAADPENTQSLPLIDPRVREMVSRGAQGVPVIIVLRRQPQAAIVERHEQAARLRMQVLEGRYAELQERATGAAEGDLSRVAAELETERLRVRREAFAEIEADLRAGQEDVEQAVRRHGATNVRRFTALNALAATAPQEAIEELAARPDVAEIALDEKLSAHLVVSAPTLGAPTFWSAGITGAGQAAAVLDTGVKTNHPAFAGMNLVSQVFLDAGKNDSCFDDNANSAEDLVGHGTHVAGIIASRGVPGWSSYFGVARGLGTLYNLKVGWKDKCSGSATSISSDVLAALNWLVQQAPGTKALNYSFGSSTSSDDGFLARMFDHFSDAYDLTASVAAGNDGPASGTVNSPGIAYNILSVAAMNTGGTTSRGDDVIAGFSSRGPTSGGRSKPDLAAPGAPGIYSADYQSNGFIPKQGTSMAAPHMAGAAALLRQAGVSSALAIKALLLNSTDSPGWSTDTGWGYANLIQAYAQRQNALSSSTSGTFRLFQAASSGTTKTTLVWNRRVATPTASTGCLSDLDLRLYNASTNGLLASSISSSNNVEQVAATITGLVVLKVSPFGSLCRVPEPFALAGLSPVAAAAGPSLSISCSAPSQVQAGAVFSVTCTAQNNGDLTAFGATATLNWSGSSGGGSNSYGNLAAGSSAARNWTVTAPSSPNVYSMRADLTSNSFGETFTAAASFNITVQSASAPPPSVSSLTPATPVRSENPQTLAVSGAGFQSGLTVTLFPPGGGSVVVSGAQIQNVTAGSFQLQATLNLTGTWGLRVNNPDGQQSAVLNFNVVGGSECSYSVSTSALAIPAQGGELVLTIRTGAFCLWSVANLPSWISVAGPSQGLGPATMTLTVSSTWPGPRIGSFTVAGISVPVRQLEATACGGSSSCRAVALPHLAFGGGWTTGLSVINTGASPGNFLLAFYGDSGVPASLPFTGGLGNLSSISDSVAAGGSKSYEAENPSLPEQGAWALATFPAEVTVHALFRRRTPQNLFYEAAVPASLGYSSFSLPFDATTFAATGAPMFTGIAIANLNPSQVAQVTCIARDAAGAVISSNAIPAPALNPMGHWAGYNFPALSGRRGTLECNASTLVSAIALRFLGYEAFSTLPVVVK